MLRRQPLGERCILFPLTATLVVFALGSGGVTAHPIEIIDATGDGAGNVLDNASAIAVDTAGNA